MQTKDFNSLLAKSIQAGIAKSKSVITKNNAKEQNGFKKLNKTLGQIPSDQTGAGTDLPAGTGTTGVPMNMAERPGEDAVSNRVTNIATMRGIKKTPFTVPDKDKRSAAKKANLRAEFEANKVEKGELGMGKTNIANCGCGWMATVLGKVGDTTHLLCTKCGNHSTSKDSAGQDGSKVAKSETSVKKTELTKTTPPGEEKLVHKLKEEYGTDKAGKEKAYATAWAIKNGTVNKSEPNPNTKKAPMIGTVEAEPVKGAKDGSEPIPEAKKTDSSGDISKGKIEKGAMVDHIKAASKKAGVNVKDVLGYKPPKTSQAVSPTPTPNFTKAVLASTPKPMIPGRGVANKQTYVDKMAASSFSPNTAKIFDTGHKVFSTLMSPEPKVLHPADKRPKSEEGSENVFKAEPTMAKPVTKSPSSGPANTTAPKAASPMISKTPKL